MAATALGEYLRDAMAKQDLSLRAFSEMIGVGHATIGRIIRGVGTVDEETLQKLQDKLPASIQTLRKLAGQPTGEREPFQIPAEFDQLDQDDRAVVLAVGRQLLIARKAGQAATAEPSVDLGGSVTQLRPDSSPSERPRVKTAARRRTDDD